MSQDIFPDPHEEEVSDDPFSGPVQDDLTDEVGAPGPADILNEGHVKSRRPALLALMGAAAVLLLFVVFSLRSGGDEGPNVVAETVTGQVDEGVVATTPDVEEEAPIIPQATEITSEAPTEADLFDPDLFVSSAPAPEPAFESDPFGQPAGTSATAQPYSPAQYQAPAAYGATTDAVSGEDLEEQARLDALREQEALEAAERQARMERMRAEEERLRGAPTLIADNMSAVTSGGGNAGQSRFAVEGDSPAASDAAPAGNDEILPGTRVGAVTTTEFISDLDGSGRVEARLTEPLRGRGGVVLPRGTKAFGQASAGGVETGRDSRVSVTFDVFVTPEGQVIRDLSGVAADPETLATSIPGKVDRRYLERVLRGVASTAVDFALTSQEDERRSAFEAPSARDMAINDARQRAAAIITGDLGDETTNQPAVTLPQGTSMVLIFGF